MLFLSHSEEDTVNLGTKLGSKLNTGDIVVLSR